MRIIDRLKSIFGPYNPLVNDETHLLRKPVEEKSTAQMIADTRAYVGTPEEQDERRRCYISRMKFVAQSMCNIDIKI